MKKRIYLFALYFLLALVHIQTVGNQFCESTFAKEDEFLNLAIKTEKLFDKIRNTEPISRDAKIIRLQSSIDRKVATLFEQGTHFQSSALSRLKKDIEALENTVDQRLSSLNNTTPTLNDLITQPEIIRANVAYRIDWIQHPQPVYVVFGQKIVDTFFHTKKDTKNSLIIAKKNLKALQKGYTGSRSKSGIQLLTLTAKGHTSNRPYYYRNKMFEVRTIGKLSGHIRWGGFIDGDFLHVIHYANNTHSKKYKRSFTMALWNNLREFHLARDSVSYRH